jgi:uncharacterized protein (DUF1778 family)
MAIGNSGRIVIDLTREEKKAIHAAIQAEGMNLKQWFLKHAYNDFPELKSSKDKSVQSK